MREAESIPEYGWYNTESEYLTTYLAQPIFQIVERLKPQKILDLGCGNGKLCSLLAEKTDADIVGMDPDRSGIEIAQNAYPDIRFHDFGVGDDPSALVDIVGNDFDLVVSTEVVEHLYSPQHLPQYAYQLLKENGKLIVTTPYHGYLKNLALAVTGKMGKHHAPLWEGGHIKFWDRKSLEQLMQENGFTPISFQGVGRLPYLWMSMIVTFQKVSFS